MSIGLIIVNVAFTALYFTRKFVRKGEEIGSKNDAVLSMMHWCLQKITPEEYPNGPQFRRIGGSVGRTLAERNLGVAASTKSFSGKQYYPVYVYKYIDDAGKNTDTPTAPIATLYFPRQP